MALEVEVEYNNFVVICYIFEWILNIIAIIFYIAWIIALKKSSIMHWNLKISCFVECLVMINSCWLRFPISLNWFLSSTIFSQRTDQILKILRDIFITHCYTAHACIAIERSLATYFVEEYENIASKKRWIAFLIFAEFITIGLYYLFLGYFDNYGIAAAFLVILEIIVGTICIYLIKVNTRNYSNTQGCQYLSTRYQLSENIRCLRPVLAFSVFANSYNFFSIFFIFITFIFYGDDAGNLTVKSNIQGFWHLFCAFIALLYPLPFIYKSRYFRRLLRKKIGKRTATIKSSKLVLYSVTGKKLTVENERKFYFQALHKSWNS